MTPAPPTSPTTVAGDVPVRMLPTTVAVEALDAPTRAVATDAWALLDGDPTHGLDATGGAARVRFALASVRAIDGLALRTTGPGRVVAYATRGAVHTPIASIDLPAAPNTWQRLRADRGATGDAIVLEWRPANPTSQLGEVELWGLAASAAVRPNQPLSDQLAAGHATPALDIAATPTDVSISPPDFARTPTAGTVRVRLDTDPRAIRRAFLSYELDGLPHWSDAVRQVNGHRAQGGFRRHVQRNAGTQIEEISPAWLRQGQNEIAFGVVRDNDPVGYRVRNLRVLAFADDESIATESPAARPTTRSATRAVRPARAPASSARRDVHVLNDGNLATGAMGRADDAYAITYASPQQWHDVVFHVAEPMLGAIDLTAGAAHMSVPLDGRAAGWHRVSLGAALGASDAVRVSVRARGERVGLVTELYVDGSPTSAETTPHVRVSYPLHGECTVQRGAYVRGFVEGVDRTALAGATLAVQGLEIPGSVADDGAIAVNVTPPPHARGRWSADLTVTLRDGRVARASVPFDACGPEPQERTTLNDPSALVEDVGAPMAVRVRSGEARTISFGDATLEIPAGAVESDTTITVRPLASRDVPPLDPGMTNVTPGGAAYRFGPHHLQFRNAIRVQLAYEASRLPTGTTEDDVGVFFYDEGERRWRDVRTVRPAARGTIDGASNHFTDFISATIARPESPQPESFNANRIQSLPLAEPGAGVTEIQPPTASSMGNASLQFPLWVPAGRAGMQPSLALQYSSDHDNGWLGVGWNLEVSRIEIDTRFGVPTYGLETTDHGCIQDDETYLFDGAALTRVGPEDGGVRFRRRVEGRFDRIIRYGGCANSYEWHVTDHSGVVSVYGSDAGSRLADHRSRGIFRWQLRSVTDTFGNRVSYTYRHATGATNGPSPTVPGEQWDQLYPLEITYTEHPGSEGVPRQGPRFRVSFAASSIERPDIVSNARAGFDIRTRELLGTIDVEFDAGSGFQRFRRYQLDYTPGEFSKSLLRSITVLGEGDRPFYAHQFEYQTVRQTDGSIGFAPPAAVGSVAIDPQANDHAGINGNAFLGVAPPFCFAHVGAGLGLAGGVERTGRSFADVNGDGLPDILDAGTARARLTGVPPGFVYANSLNRGTGAVSLVPEILDANPGDLTRTWDGSWNVDLAIHIPFDYAGYTHSWSWSANRQDAVMADADGDGFVDLVRGPRNVDGNDVLDVLENPYSQGTRRFGTTSGPGSNYTLGGFVNVPSRMTIDSPRANAIRGLLHRTDPVVRWRAPYPGRVRLSGLATRETNDGADTVTVSVYHRAGAGASAVQRTLFACGAAPGGDACDPSIAGEISVAMGDTFYFRAHGAGGTTGGGVHWDPTVSYTFVDPNCSLISGCVPPQGTVLPVFSQAADFRLENERGQAWEAGLAGRVEVHSTFERPAGMGDIQWRVERWHTSLPSTVVGDARELLDLTATRRIDPLNAGTVSASGSAITTTIGGTYDVEAGDEIHFVVELQRGDDPANVHWSPHVRYTNVCRTSDDGAGGACPAILSCSVQIPAVGTQCRIAIPSGDPGPDSYPESVLDRAAEPAFRSGVIVAESGDPMVGWWRGWAVGEWNGDVETFDTSRISEVAPSIDGVPLSFDDEATARASMRRVYDAIRAAGSADAPTVSAPTFATMTPRRVQDAACRPELLCNGGTGCDVSAACRDVPVPSYVGTGSLSFVASGQMRTSRTAGVQLLPGADPQLQTAERTARRAFAAPGLRAGHSSAQSDSANALGASLGGSNNESVNDLDFFDMDGDRRPDSVRLDYVQYQERPTAARARRALETPHDYRARNRFFSSPQRVAMGFGAVRRVRSTSFRLSPFVRPPASTPSGEHGQSGASGLDRQPQSHAPSFGRTEGNSETEIEWIDLNGDGLPDHVSLRREPIPDTSPTQERQLLDYQLNLGHALGRVNTIEVRIGSGQEPPSQAFHIRREQTHSNSLQWSFGAFGAGPQYTLLRTVEDMVDLNGDGLPDIVRRDDSDPNAFHVRLNRGESFGPEFNWSARPWGLPLVDPVLGLTLPNADVLAFQSGTTVAGSVGFNGSLPVGPFFCLVGEVGGNIQGTERFGQLQFEDIDGDGLVDHVLRVWSPLPGLPAPVMVRHNSTERANLLVRVVRPMGGDIRLEYTRQGNERRASVVGVDPDGPIAIDMPRNQWALSAVTVSDGRTDRAPDRYRTTFRYGDASTPNGTGFFDREERENFGHALVRATQPDGSTVTTYYHNQDYYRRGLVHRVEQRDAAGMLFRLTVNTYSTPTGIDPRTGSFFPQSTASTRRVYEGDTADPIGRSLETTIRRHFNDTTGLLEYELEENGPLPDDDVVHCVEYDRSLLVQNIARATNASIRVPADGANPCVGSVLRERTATYDGRAALRTITDRLERGRNPATLVAYDGSAATNPTSTFSYDAVGNLQSATDASGYNVRYTYDDPAHAYRTSSTDSFGYVAHAEYDDRYGVALHTQDVNGAHDTRRLDAFGRLVGVWGPYQHTGASIEGHSAAVTFSYTVADPAAPSFPARSITRQFDEAHPDDTLDTSVFADGLGRTIQTRRDAVVGAATGPLAVGVTVSGRVDFDARGRVRSQGQPTFEALGDIGTFTAPVGPALNPTLTTYDILSRPVDVEAPDHTHTRTQFGIRDFLAARRHATLVTDPLGRVRVVFRDERDNISIVVERNTIRGTLTDLATRYAYDRLSQLTEVTDALGNRTCAAYDSLGQMVRLDSLAHLGTAGTCDRAGPGVTESLYDPAGRLGARQTANMRARDAANSFTRYRYTFHRLDAIDYPSTATSPDVSMTYGPPDAPNGGAGRLVDRADASGTEHREYGLLGEVVRTQRTLDVAIPGRPASQRSRVIADTHFQHDSLGRMLSMTYPDGAELLYDYDLGGRLASATMRTPAPGRPGTFDERPYVQRVTYDRFGQRTSVTLGNGVTTAYRYDDVMRRLSDLDTDVPASGGVGTGAAPLQRLRYAYNSVGNIVALRNDLRGSVAPGFGGRTDFTFDYDGLDQLTHAVGAYTRTFGGASSLRQFVGSMAYDELGRIRLNTQSDALLVGGASALQPETTHDLTYAYTGMRPHATTTLTDARDGVRTLEYDSDGNQTHWSQRAGVRGPTQTRDLAWDDEDRLLSVDDGPGAAPVNYVYDADGARTHRFGSRGRVSYVSQFWTVSNDTLPTRHVFADGVRIASVVDPPGMGPSRAVEFFYHTDHLQSTQYITNGLGAPVEHLEYFPFGEQWIDEERAGALVMTGSGVPAYRFTGHEYDPDTRLTYAGARYYDARVAQWCSEEPALGSFFGSGPRHGRLFHPGSLALYGYGHNSPLASFDPDGEDPRSLWIQGTIRPFGVSVESLDRRAALRAQAEFIRQGDQVARFVLGQIPVIGGILHGRESFVSLQQIVAERASPRASGPPAIGPGTPGPAMNYLGGAMPGGGATDDAASRVPPGAASSRAGQGPAADTSPAGARGPSSGRAFDPANAGGPVRSLSTTGVRVTTRGIDVVERHLARFGPDAPNSVMVGRLRRIAAGELSATQSDLNFYTHELREFVRYRRMGHETGNPGRDVWNNAHTATLEDYGINERAQPDPLYHPSAGAQR